MTLVVDANVALCWSFEAPDSAKAISLLHNGDHLIAPDLIIPEVTNALFKLIGVLPEKADRARDAIAFLPRWFSEIVPSQNLRIQALDLALELRHPAYDCCYLALALSRGVKLVSADVRFLRRTKEGRYGKDIIGLNDLPEH